MYLLRQIFGDFILVVSNIVHLMREVFAHVVDTLEVVAGGVV